MRRADLAIEWTKGDLVFSDGDLVLVEDAAQVEQSAAIVVQTNLGEYFIDGRVGTDIFRRILGRPPTSAIRQAELRRSVRTVPGITYVQRVEIEIDDNRRIRPAVIEIHTEFEDEPRVAVQGDTLELPEPEPGEPGEPGEIEDGYYLDGEKTTVPDGFWLAGDNTGLPDQCYVDGEPVKEELADPRQLIGYDAHFMSEIYTVAELNNYQSVTQHGQPVLRWADNQRFGSPITLETHKGFEARLMESFGGDPFFCMTKTGVRAIDSTAVDEESNVGLIAPTGDILRGRDRLTMITCGTLLAEPSNDGAFWYQRQQGAGYLIGHQISEQQEHDFWISLEDGVAAVRIQTGIAVELLKPWGMIVQFDFATGFLTIWDYSDHENHIYHQEVLPVGSIDDVTHMASRFFRTTGSSFNFLGLAHSVRIYDGLTGGAEDRQEMFSLLDRYKPGESLSTDAMPPINDDEEWASWLDFADQEFMFIETDRVRPTFVGTPCGLIDNKTTPDGSWSGLGIAHGDNVVRDGFVDVQGSGNYFHWPINVKPGGFTMAFIVYFIGTGSSQMVVARHAGSSGPNQFYLGRSNSSTMRVMMYLDPGGRVDWDISTSLMNNEWRFMALRWDPEGRNIEFDMDDILQLKNNYSTQTDIMTSSGDVLISSYGDADNTAGWHGNNAFADARHYSRRFTDAELDELRIEMMAKIPDSTP